MTSAPLSITPATLSSWPSRIISPRMATSRTWCPTSGRDASYRSRRGRLRCGHVDRDARGARGLRASGRVVAEALRAMRRAVRPGITHRRPRRDRRADLPPRRRPLGAPDSPTASPAPPASASTTRRSTASPAPAGCVRATWSSSTWPPSSTASTPTPASRWASGAPARDQPPGRGGAPRAHPGPRGRAGRSAAERDRRRHRARGRRPWLRGLWRAHGSRDRPAPARGARRPQRLRPGPDRAASPTAWCSPSSRSSAPARASCARRRDGWTVCTADGALSAHEEHTIVITPGAPLVLTA